MDMFCEYNSQGFYACDLKNKPPKDNKCGDNKELIYRAMDTHYDMNMKAMLYQLRATQKGYDTAIHREKSDK